MSRYWDDPELNLQPVQHPLRYDLLKTTLNQKKYALKVLVVYWTKVTQRMFPKFKKYSIAKYQLLNNHRQQVVDLITSLRKFLLLFTIPRTPMRIQLLKVIERAVWFVNHHYLSFKYSFDQFP